MENGVTKLDTSCWNGQICLDNSEWLAQNIKGIDQSVKEMLQLIEHDGDSLLEKVDDNHPKQPELIARIKVFSQRHHLLADHYNKLTGGELSSHSKPANERKNNEKTIFDPQLTPPFLTPMNKLRMQDVESQVVGSDFLSLSSGGGIPDATPNEGSDSDSETYYASPNESLSSLPSKKMMKHETVNMETEISEAEGHTYQMLSVYEKEINISNEKLLFAEEEIAKLKRELQDNEMVMVKLEAEVLPAKNRIKLQEAEIEKEKERSLTLQRKVVDLEGELESEKKRVQELEGSVRKYTVELSDRDVRIQKLNAELQDASGNFALEKWQLESSVSILSESLSSHETKTKQLQMQFETLIDENKKCQAEKAGIEKKQEALRITWQDDIERELSKKNAAVDTLNRNLDGLKLRYDMLVAEKDEANAKSQSLNAEISCRDDRIRRLEHNLNELVSELIAGSDSADKLIDELKSRIDELGKEVQMQATVISDMAEGKREAIRQLCFSIDHFKCAYKELRNAYVAHKGPTVMAS